MTTKQKSRPAAVELNEDALNRAVGGVGTHALYQDLVVPTSPSATNSGGINVLLADGSVRGIK